MGPVSETLIHWRFVLSQYVRVLIMIALCYVVTDVATTLLFVGVYQITTKSAFYMWAPTSCGPGANISTGVTCPLGHFCIGGVPTLCAAGKYGASTGLSSASCSGDCSCASGTYCPAGTSAGPTAGCVSCPSGTYCTGGTANALLCSCSAGTVCPTGGSISTNCQPCPLGYYCAYTPTGFPGNTVWAVPCPAG